MRIQFSGVGEAREHGNVWADLPAVPAVGDEEPFVYVVVGRPAYAYEVTP